MDWLEFTVVLVCGLFGFIAVNYLIDQHRSPAETSQKNTVHKSDKPGATEQTDQKP